MSPGEPKPRAPRIDVDYPAVLVTSDGQPLPVRVRDLSREGFRVEIDDEVLIGERITLRVGRGEDMVGEIRWALGREAGGIFLTKAVLPSG